MMVPVLNRIKNNVKPETKSSNNLQSVIGDFIMAETKFKFKKCELLFPNEGSSLR